MMKFGLISRVALLDTNGTTVKAVLILLLVGGVSRKLRSVLFVILNSFTEEPYGYSYFQRFNCPGVGYKVMSIPAPFHKQ